MLLEVAQRPPLGSKIRTLRIDTHCPRFHTWITGTRKGRYQDFVQWRKSYADDWKCALLSADVITGCPNLRNVGLGDLGHKGGKHLDYSSEM